ncbi:CHAP domain-containing protein [Candidatus Saccharibacteria bacterium]|nr:CHAP domain-containing protein [Candidatus Saccharibacteria bacterium]
MTKIKLSSLPTAFKGLLLAVLVMGLVVPTIANADRFTDQINQLKNENSQKEQVVQALAVEADSIAGVIAGLQTQINGLQAQINTNQAAADQLQIDITAAEIELAKQKSLMGQNIRAMYLEGDISTLEMLASSKDLSEFIDKQQYRDAVKDKIKSTLDRVNALKAQLKSAKEETERLIQEDNRLKAQADANKAEQDRLLGFNQSQQADYNSQIKDNKTKISELKRQQVLENIRLFGGGGAPGIPGGGGYPWGNAYCVHTGQIGGACYNYDWYFNGGPWDVWGYGYRNCTSWVAYKLAAEGKSGFSYLGNAADWPSGAAARGLRVSYGSGAQVGDAAVNPNGYYGHVMYVEAILPDGRVVVSDYNRLGDGLYRGPDGNSAGVLNQNGLVFITF